MIEVIPAILADDFEELRERISQVVNLVSIVQIDICDGKFVPTTSWPMGHGDEHSVNTILSEEEGLPYWDSLDFELDLMVANAHTKFEFFSRLGARRIVFHIEAENDRAGFKEFLEGLDMYTKENIDIGLAINTTTPLESIKDIIHLVDYVQCMGIEKIGHQGEPFDERVLEQIKSLRMNYPELIISVDGSINEKTAKLVVDAGADRLVVGSALMRSYDVRETIKYFEDLKK